MVRREMLLPTCARVSRGETQREREKERADVSLFQCTHAHAGKEDEESLATVEYRRFGVGVIKRNLARG